MPGDWDEMALVGRIARAHGRSGEVIIDPETDFAEERFSLGGHLYVREGATLRRLAISAVRFQRGRPVVAFEGVETIDAAEDLAGRELRIPEGALQRLPNGVYYEHDLVGCLVETRAGETVGSVSRVGGGTGNTWLEVQGRGGEVLVPFALEICVEIDTGRRRIVIDPPEGLLEANLVR